MSVYPNLDCYYFCQWLTSIYWGKLTATQLNVIGIVSSAASTGSSVTELEWRNFQITTRWRYKYYQQYVALITPYSSEALAYFAAMPTQPSIGFKSAVNEFINGCSSDGNWSELDACWLLACETEGQSFINMVTPGSYSLVKSGSPIFEALKGWSGVSNTGYLRTGFNLSTNSVNYTLNSASIGSYSRTDSQTANYDAGASDSANDTWLSFRSASNQSNIRINMAGGGVASVVSNSLGLFTGLRVSSSETRLYQGSNLLSPSASTVSSALPNRELYLLTRNGNGTAATSSLRQQSFCFIGSGSVNVGLLSNRINSLAVLLGFNV